MSFCRLQLQLAFQFWEWMDGYVQRTASGRTFRASTAVQGRRRRSYLAESGFPQASQKGRFPFVSFRRDIQAAHGRNRALAAAVQTAQPRLPAQRRDDGRPRLQGRLENAGGGARRRGRRSRAAELSMLRGRRGRWGGGGAGPGRGTLRVVVIRPRHVTAGPAPGPAPP